MATKTMSARQAAAAVGVSRTVVSAVLADGLIGPGELDACDLVVLKGATFMRSILFPGETQPANTSREVRPRERQLADELRRLYASTPSTETCAVVFADKVTVTGDTGSLITTVLAAQGEKETYVVLPVGEWIREAQTGAGVTVNTS